MCINVARLGLQRPVLILPLLVFEFEAKKLILDCLTETYLTADRHYCTMKVSLPRHVKFSYWQTITSNSFYTELTYASYVKPYEGLRNIDTAALLNRKDSVFTV